MAIINATDKGVKHMPMRSVAPAPPPAGAKPPEGQIARGQRKRRNAKDRKRGY